MNPFGILPMMRYIIPLFQKASTFVYTIHIKGFYDFHNAATQVNLDECNSVGALNNQSRWRRFRKYTRAIYFLFRHMIWNKKSRYYFIDYQLLAFGLWIKKYWRRNSHIIYHQFELFDPSQFNGLTRKLQLSVLRNARYIDCIIFPEVNRMDYFTKASGIDPKHTFILPNTNNLHPQKTTRTDDLFEWPSSVIVLGHVGSLGIAHYVQNYFDYIECSIDPDLRFLFIGSMDNSIKTKVLELKEKDHRIIYIPELPHDELIKYYNRIDIGIILYRGVDLNNEFCAPNKLYEFWAYGIPVVAHALKGLKPVFKMDFQGKLIDFEKREQLQSAVNQLKISATNHKDELRQYFQMTNSFDAYLPALEAQIESW